ncbi:hypothetical protein SAMN04487904_107127 [Actinopolyspora lacussalsi subsp. righensis]|uniref:Uncharacterized protein n=1 Tax=Actinopolyspora righensis TaxID=995060 RepID=A0A1I7AJM1_9ACTN|nr:hypothetical protein [Actinopolyspora righensis]SFT75138.1 hypothetical protein SAMN04487904_107127 [Actinopolyspora righensis]
MTEPLLALTGAFLLPVVAITLAIRTHPSRYRPRHALAGVDALTVGKLLHRTTGAFPTYRPGLAGRETRRMSWSGTLWPLDDPPRKGRPGSRYLPGSPATESTVPDRDHDSPDQHPELLLMRRVLDGLRAL